MKRSAWFLAIAVVVAGCTLPRPGIDPDVRAELDKANEPQARAAPGSVEQALLPPLKMEMPTVRGQPAEQLFDLSVSNAPAAQVFMSITSGTRYSMLVHPNVSGLITINLKDVTVSEALNAIRELYGYEYKVEGSRIFIQPVTIQTKVFNVNYLIGQRLGRSDIRVTSGA